MYLLKPSGLSGRLKLLNAIWLLKLEGVFMAWQNRQDWSLIYLWMTISRNQLLKSVKARIMTRTSPSPFFTASWNQMDCTWTFSFNDYSQTGGVVAWQGCWTGNAWNQITVVPMQYNVSYFVYLMVPIKQNKFLLSLNRADVLITLLTFQN